jgi:hypothetical protein
MTIGDHEFFWTRSYDPVRMVLSPVVQVAPPCEECEEPPPPPPPATAQTDGETATTSDAASRSKEGCHNPDNGPGKAKRVTVADVHASVVAMGGRVSALEVELKEKDEMLARVLEEVKELRSKLQQQN